MAVPLVLQCGPAPRLPAQEPPPQTEQQRQAREILNKGVQDFKNGQYDAAISEFEGAKALNPQFLNARLYLATAYAAKYIPGAPGEANQELGRKAVDEYRGVLEIDPQNLSATDGIGLILFQMGTPYDYRAVTGQQVQMADPLPPDVRQVYIREYGSIIDEGIASLKHAIELRPGYDDAMAYLNLLYRRKADAANYQDERDGLLQMADDLVDKVKEIKQRRAEQPAQP